MKNEELIRKLIQGSIQRAIQESAAALFVLIAFAAILQNSDIGSFRYYGCLCILISTGFIVGVVWSYALSDKLLRSHPSSDVGFWREAFHAQAQLLRTVPCWYCGPVAIGTIMFCLPTDSSDLVPFLIVSSILLIVFVGVGWLNRAGAAQLEQSGTELIG